MGFTIVCDKCGNKNTVETGYSGMITKDEIDIEVIEDFSGWHTTVEGVDITCYKCNNEVRV